MPLSKALPSICRVVGGLVVATLLAGCEPGVHMGWDNEVGRVVDVECVYDALKTIVPVVQRRTYVSDGAGYMPANVPIVQFVYAETRPEGIFMVDVANLPNGRARFYHQWAKVGTSISRQERSIVTPMLIRANKAIATHCDLPISSDRPHELH